MTTTEDRNGARTEAAVVADLAAKATSFAAQYLGEDQDLAVFRVASDERIEQINLEGYLPAPRRSKGQSYTIDAASFIEYVNRYRSDTATTVWANYERNVLVAVIDDHGKVGDTSGVPGWGQHRVTLNLQPTNEWQHWIARDGRLMDQGTFAEHLEDGADCIVTPAAADMLEIAQSFHAKNNVAFRSANRLDSGEVQLQYEETITAKAGQRGNMAIPLTFELGLAPYEGTDAYRLIARFRYRLNDGRLSLGYRMVRPDQIQRAAFDDVCNAVADGVQLPVMKGTPRS